MLIGQGPSLGKLMLMQLVEVATGEELLLAPVHMVAWMISGNILEDCCSLIFKINHFVSRHYSCRLVILEYAILEIHR